MSEKITKELYNKSVKIDFYPESHRYKLQGERTYLISCTACTGMIDKSRFLIPWAVGLDFQYLKGQLEKSEINQFTREELAIMIEEAQRQHAIKKEEAASIGSQVHEWAEKFATAKIEGHGMPLLSPDDDERVLNGINAFLEWITAHKVKFYASEKLVYSLKHGFVGIADAIAEVDGKKVLIDYKTGKSGHYHEYKFQLAAYCMAFEEETNTELYGGVILHFNKENGEFEAIERNKEEIIKDYQTFLSLLQIKKRLKELD